MTFPLSSLGPMTGMPVGKKKTKRGGKRFAKKKGPPGNPMDHHANIATALAANDHDAARKHTFALVRSLRPPSPTPAAVDDGDDPDTEGPADQQAEAPPKPAMNPNRLLAALRARKA